MSTRTNNTRSVLNSNIRAGVSIALSGDLGASGVPIQNAVRVAEQQINANGGVLGRRVVFKVVDDATDKGTVVSGIVNQMMDEGAVAIRRFTLSEGHTDRLLQWELNRAI